MASLVEEPLGGADGERKALLNLEIESILNKMAPSFSSLSLTLFLSFCAAQKGSQNTTPHIQHWLAKKSNGLPWSRGAAAQLGGF